METLILVLNVGNYVN